MILDLKTLHESIINLATNAYIHLFFVLILIDLASGLGKGILTKVGNSTIGLNGLIRHALIILIVIAVAIYFPVFGLEKYATWFIMFFILQYLISIVENLGELGVPLPEYVKDALSKLNEKANKGENITVDKMIVNKQEHTEEEIK